MLVVLGQGGLAAGGLNFDAKVRRESFEPIDLFHAHIGGMDAFAQGLKIAAAMRADGVLTEMVASGTPPGTLASARTSNGGVVRDARNLHADQRQADANTSGRQEMLENLINRYL